MPNKYCNLDGGKLIKDEYPKINTGFDRVSDDMIGVNKRVNNIITTPVDSISAQEIIDARGGKEVLNDRFKELVRYQDVELGTPVGINSDTLGGNMPIYYGKQSDINALGLSLEQKADKLLISYTANNQTELDNILNSVNSAANEQYAFMVYVNFSGGNLVGGRYKINGIKHSGTYETQTAIVYNPTGTLKLSRSKNNGVWNNWVTDATTDKIDILLTPSSADITIISQSCHRDSLGKTYIQAIIESTAGLAQNARVQVLTLPSSFTQTTLCATGTLTTDGIMGTLNATCYANTTAIYIKPLNGIAKTIVITGVLK